MEASLVLPHSKGEHTHPKQAKIVSISSLYEFSVNYCLFLCSLNIRLPSHFRVIAIFVAINMQPDVTQKTVAVVVVLVVVFSILLLWTNPKVLKEQFVFCSLFQRRRLGTMMPHSLARLGKFDTLLSLSLPI